MCLLNQWNKVGRGYYFQSLDVVTAELERRFNQPGMKVAAEREQILICAAQNKWEKQKLPPMPEKINRERLALQHSNAG